MRSFIKKSVFFSLIIVLLMLFTISNVQAEELVVGMNNQAGDINPLVGLNIGAEYVDINIYDTLVGRASQTTKEGYLIEDSNNFTPELAKSWEITDNVSTYTFKLREDVNFHNGSKFDAEDVDFTFELMQKKGSYAEYFKNLIKEINIIDPFTVEVKLNRPEPKFLKRISTYNACVMDKETVFEEAGSDIDDQMKWLASNAIGTGPYILESLSTNSVHMKINEDYFGEIGNIEKIVLLTISETSNRRIMIEKGDIHIATSPSQNDYEALENNDEIDLLIRPGNSKVVYFSMNLNHEPFDDKMIREAIAYAVPYEAIINIAAGGEKYAPRAHSLLTSELHGYKPVFNYEHNPEKARQLVKKAGYEDGLEIQFDLFSAGTYPKCAEILQQELKNIGIDLKIKEMAPPAFFQAGSAGNLNFIINSWWDNVADPVGLLTDLTHSKSIPEQGNWAQISVEEIDRSLNAAQSELDSEKRAKLLESVQELVNEKLGYIPLWEAKIIMAMRKNVNGYVHYSDALFRFSEMNID